MQIGFFFWPFTPELTRQMAGAAEEFGFSMIGVADTPTNAMDPWVAATMVAQATSMPQVAICVTNLVTRHPSVTAAAIASLDLLSEGRSVLGVGAGHSGTQNLGARSSSPGDLKDGIEFMRTLLHGEPASLDGADAQLPWVRRAPPLFLAASGPGSLRAAVESADGVFVNYGLRSENVTETSKRIDDAAARSGRKASELDVWHIACLDCAEERGTAADAIGNILAFVASYVVGGGDATTRGVPEEMAARFATLRQRYVRRPGSENARLVRELGLFDYLSQRLAVYGDPQDCLEQVLAAREAGVSRLMFTVSLASDPVRTVRLFGEHVLPRIRGDGRTDVRHP